MKDIILASASPRRKELLEQIGLKFRIVASDYDEQFSPHLEPRALARVLSLRKAQSVAARHAKAVIIAADTFIAYRGHLLGKPKSKAEAKEMLSRLSGKSHSVITGYTVMDTENGKTVSRSEETKVFFRNFSSSEIDSYIRSGEPMDKAGAYGIQGMGALLVKKIEGDYFNVVGLPLSALTQVLKAFGIDPLRGKK